MRKRYTTRLCCLCCLISLLLLQACSVKDSNTEENQTTPLSDSIHATSPTIPPTELPAPTEQSTPTPLLEKEKLSFMKSIEDVDFAPYFDMYANATMLISDGSTQMTYNETASLQRYTPCSTFKIPNSLIALENGTIQIENSKRQWDGTIHWMSDWNKDQDLASAIQYSCVWYYKELAKEVGDEYMQKYLNELEYGNNDISGGIDTFWLNSSLQISPQEQLDFIIRLFHQDLPFADEYIAYVKSIMKLDVDNMDIYGKTGSSGQRLGWFVGYIIIEENPYCFVTCIEGDEVSGIAAKELTIEIFSQYIKEQ